MNCGTEPAARSGAAAGGGGGRPEPRRAGAPAALAALLVAAVTCAAAQPAHAVAAAAGPTGAAAAAPTTAGAVRTPAAGGVVAVNLRTGKFGDVPQEATSGVKSLAAPPTGGTPQTLHQLALKEDGGVIAWGANGRGQADVPAAAASGVTAVAAGADHSVALKEGGAVIAWGADGDGQSTVPAAAASGVDAISAGNSFSLALKGGRVLAWGSGSAGQTRVPAGAASDVTAVSAGGSHALALKKDGTVIAWGTTNYGVTKVPAAAASGVVAVAAGELFSMVLKADGTVIAWGAYYGTEKVLAPSGSGVTAISAASVAALLARGDGTITVRDAGRAYDLPASLKTGVTATALAGATLLAVRTVPAPEVASPRPDAVTGALRPAITGKGVPGAEVTVKAKDGDAVLARGTVHDDGTWSVTPDKDLVPGRVTISVTQTLHGVASPAVERSFTTLAALPAKDLSEIVLADFTGDGKADILAKPKESAGLHLFKGRGDGTFEPGTKVFDTWAYTQTTAGDFDGDGAADLVATDPAGTLHLWRGKGDGSFADRQKLTGWAGKEQTTAGDVDGDGVTDLVALDTKDHKLKLWKGTKDGAGNPFARPRNLTKWEGFEQSSLGDLDGKGLAHLIAARTDPKTGKTSLRLWKSKGDVPGNPFEKPHHLTNWADFTHTTLGDVDGDRTADLIAVDNRRNQLKIWKSNGRIDANPFGAPLNVALYLAP